MNAPPAYLEFLAAYFWYDALWNKRITLLRVGGTGRVSDGCRKGKEVPSESLLLRDQVNFWRTNRSRSLQYEKEMWWNLLQVWQPQK